MKLEYFWRELAMLFMQNSIWANIVTVDRRHSFSLLVCHKNCPNPVEWPFYEEVAYNCCKSLCIARTCVQDASHFSTQQWGKKKKKLTVGSSVLQHIYSHIKKKWLVKNWNALGKYEILLCGFSLYLMTMSNKLIITPVPWSVISKSIDK